MSTININPKKMSLAEDVAERILLIILDGYKPGMQIPSENELGTQLGVGRNTVREAIRALVSRNILEIRRGNGTFVSDRQGVADDPLGLMFFEDRHKVAEDIMQIRMLLEPSIASLAAQNATDEEIAELERLAQAFEEKIVRRENPIAEDVAFHRHIAKCSKNLVMPNLIPIISETIRIFTDIEEGKKIETTLITHVRIVEAVRSRNPSGAYEAMRSHLTYNYNKLVKTS